jgi:uncharacterized phage protein (TIGR01671 family)
MREILFRGKTYSNKWVYGYLIKGSIDNDFYILENVGGTPFCINPETIGQFTGLTELTTGKKIFEGDIVKATISINDYSRDKVRNEEGIYEIKYHTKHCYFYLAKEGNNLLFDGNWKYYLKGIKVIGNIHNNPELLGE